MKHQRELGIGLATFGSLLWGVSGPASEHIFGYGVSVSWLISSKMLMAGVVTMILALLIDKRHVLDPWRTKKDAIQMIIFIIFGMVTMQYIYFKAVEVANAATATILQYLAPVLIMVIMAIRSRSLPRRIDVVVIAMALFGTALVVTKGHFTQLAISPRAFFWGIMAAWAAVAYNMLPEGLLARHSPLTVTAWAQLLGGIGMTVYHPFWVGIPHMPADGWWSYAFIVVFGTIVAYLVYLASLQYISAEAASLLDAFEPLGATVVAVTLLHLHMGPAELAGGAIIIATVSLMVITTPKAPQLKEN
ncbi:DMT family transporter [Lacticaseibacillus yichunensis]|uniref:DMT family transporter n=2 Tax=Bacilli TaxID=91061 RepID=A0ABW4CLC0_9LACO|nr:DMT family transporter [Lacticaseibacillus yichunensis]